MTADRSPLTALTDQRVLTGDAYATDRHLSARQRLYQSQQPRFDLPALVAEQLTDTTGTLMDVGCGNGWYLRHLRRHRADLTVIGIDLSAGILHQVQPPVLVADAARLPLADHSTNAVLAMHMLYHLPDLDAGLRELSRILAPDGLLIASTNARMDKIELDQLWSCSAADVLGIPDGPHRVSLSDRFPLDDAPGHLTRYFADVRVLDLRGVITVTDPTHVIAHLGSYRTWAEHSGVPFDETLNRARQRLTETIDHDGAFTITCHNGIVTCRNALSILQRQP
jgi:SAM-dependent methyltransferase